MLMNMGHCRGVEGGGGGTRTSVNGAVETTGSVGTSYLTFYNYN